MQSYLYQDLYNLENKHWWHISKRRVVKEMVKKYHDVKKPKILDIGCGTGKNIEDLQNIGTIYGLDNSPQALKYCKMRGLKNLTRGSAERTNLNSDYFDIITLLDVLEHTDDQKVLKEMRRILKVNGIIIITVPAFWWLWSKWDEVLHHKRRYTKENLQDLLIKNNFYPIKITYLYAFLVIPAFIIRKIKEGFLKSTYPSDFKLSNHLLNFLLGKLSQLEFFFAQKVSLPIGTSILAVARKND